MGQADSMKNDEFSVLSRVLSCDTANVSTYMLFADHEIIAQIAARKYKSEGRRYPFV
jgi:hypothetical protein